MPTLGSIDVRMCAFLYALLNTTSHKLTICHTSRVWIASARNELIREFLKSDNEYLLFLDDDNPPEDVWFLDRMIADKKPVVSWLVPSRLPDEDKRHRLCIFGEWIKEDGRHEYFQAFRVPKSKETFQIANCGMGCVLIERWLVKMVSEEFDLPCEERMVWYFDWGEEWWIRDERMDYDKAKNWMLRFKRRMSEDLLFFERCRDFGATLWCNPTVQCEHFSGGDVISIKTHIWK